MTGTWKSWMSHPPQMPLLLMLLLLLFSVSPAASRSRKPAKDGDDNVCQSVECVTLSAQISSHMNASANPCQDFYNFACGNFPNVVKYNPLKGASVPLSVFSDDVLFEDTIGIMSDKLERNMYELLALDRVATSKDPEMSELYNFTRQFYRSCRRWRLMSSDGGENYKSMSARILRSIYSHLNRTMRELQPRGALPIESLLAALVKAGGVGMVSLSLPRMFAEQVISKDDYNLTKSVRTSISLEIRHFFHENLPAVDPLVRFFVINEIGIPELGRLSANGSKIFGDLYAELRSEMFKPWSADNCTVNEWKRWNDTFTVSELDRLAACVRPWDPFSWTRFFEDLLQQPVDPAALVEVDNLPRLMLFVTFFKSRQNPTPSVADATFLVVDWLLSFSTFLPQDLVEKAPANKVQAIYVTDGGNSVTACMMLTKYLLQPVVERMYQRAYHREDFRDIKQLVQLIKDASIQGVRQQSWITRSAKDAIVKKIQSMKQSIGLDDLTAGELKTFYNATLTEFREIRLQANDLEGDFGSLVSLAQCAYARKNLDIMTGGSPVSMFMDISPLVVNAFNWLQKNQIIFPMAILAPPIYHPSYPEYINIGSLGYIIGHEIGHSFDNMGHTINTMGATGHFWDGQTEKAYLERMECVRARYGTYLLHPGGRPHLSNDTLGNDIADLMGIRAATEALKIATKRAGRRPMQRMPNLPSHLTSEQLLFIQAAQSWCLKSEPRILELLFGDRPSHSPHHLRVRGFVENSQEFADAFKCHRGAPMNPTKKCTFW